ncbi:MAG: Eco57I restriction-modification methylase domain-containing protein [Rikenellaceae bacterium]
MTRETLQNIFRNPYSLEIWQNLLINLFGASEIRRTPAEIESDKQDKVSGYLLGELNTSDHYRVGLFAFEVGANTKIEMNRVGLRSLVRSYTKYQYDAAISVYYNDKQWRLSFISDLKGENTSPKRFTYVFGNEVENYRTAACQLIKLYNTKPTFESIKDAFSVEKLSRDFFAEYKKQYDKFVGSIGDNKSNRDYVKKMMGRLVFLQFLQKKGWMNGDLNYLQNLYNNSEYKDDFLEKVLEPLFFEVLNTKEDNRKPEKIKNLGAKVEIPYLNGGLFERDSNDQRVILFDASYFENLLEFFSHYNFTIDENDPYDAEVGIDPEMLGHIFENLLEDNKDKGAFYTPKEIVQYMCRQSLIEYLQSKLGKHSEIEAFVNRHDVSSKFIITNAREIERHLDEVKICDPAIGSGAFPMGILNEIFHCKMALDLTLDRAETKKAIIQNSIYGVDIEQGAVDIARLRFWLSLVVDEDVPQPLPNLDYKIMCGNSLLSRHALDTPIKEVFAEYNKGKKKEDQFTLESYKALVSGYTNNSNKEEKAAFRTKIEEIKRAFKTELDKNVIKKRIKLQSEINNLKADNLFGTASKEELKLAKEKEKKLKIMLDNEANITNNKLYADAFEWRFELPALLDEDGVFMGFDIVIGNPPYIQLQANGGLLGEMYKDAGFETFTRTGDIYSLFYEKGIQLLRTGGIEAFITSSKWMRAAYGEKARAFFAKNNPLRLVDLGANIFDSATVDTNILIIAKGQNQNGMLVASAKEKLVDVSMLSFSSMPSIDNGNWIILSPIEQSIKQKINKVGIPLQDWNININRGVVTGYNNAFIIPTSKKKEILSNCISDQERENTEKVIRPILRGKDIQCFNAIWADLWIIYIPWHFPMHDNQHLKGASADAELAFENDYPALYNYLLEHKSSLMLRNKEETGIRYEWYSLQRWGANYWHELDNHKIIWKRIGSILRFSFDTSKSAVLDSTCFATGDGLRYLVAVLNSKMGNYLFKDAPKTGTGDLLISVQAVNPVKVPQLTEEQQQPYIDRVNQILDKKRENPQADTSALEAEIDQMVYALYNLTPEEINLIENR